jgi:hypothetical protein
MEESGCNAPNLDEEGAIMKTLTRQNYFLGITVSGLIMLSACKEGGQYEGSWGFEVNGEVVQEMEVEVASQNGDTFMRFTRQTGYGEPMVDIVEVHFEEGEVVPVNPWSDVPEILANGKMRYAAEIWTPQ